MRSRREFIQSGLAISAMGGLVNAATAASEADRQPASAAVGDASSEPRIRISLLVYDRQFADSRAFGAAARQLGRARQAIAGDVTALWYDTLYPLWKHPGVSIAGMTGVSSLFCLEQLAWKSERRVVLRVRHERGADGRISHTLAGPSPLLAGGANRLFGATDWPRQMLRWVLGVPLGARPVLPEGMRSAGAARSESVQVYSSAGSADDWHEPLVSWVIAPRRALDRLMEEGSDATARS